MTEITFDGRNHLVLINGQSGNVASDINDKVENPIKPDKTEKPVGLLEFLGNLIDD
jgi:hypothetical protein